VIDDRDLFERAIRRFPPPESSFDRLIIRRARKRRNQRLAAGAVGLTIIALAAVLVFTNIIRADEPAPIEQPPVMHNGDITVFGYPGGLRSLSLDGRHERSLVRCQGSCTLVSSAAWFPNGMKVAFSPTCAGGCGTLGDPYHGIRVVDLATGDDRLLVSGDFFSRSTGPRTARVSPTSRTGSSTSWTPTDPTPPRYLEHLIRSSRPHGRLTEGASCTRAVGPSP